MVLRIILFAVIALTCILFFYFIRKERVVESTLREAYGALDEAAVKRLREEKINIFAQAKGFQRKGNRLIEKPYRLFIYSGIGRTFAGISFELWSVIVLIFAAFLYFIGITITGSVFKALVMSVIFILIILGIEKILAMRNYRIVDSNLIKFLNIFGNFNVTEGEIMNILLQTSRYLPSPLRDVLEEGYYAAQTSGDKTSSLYAMADNIEHPKFKEIICNVEICEKYTANYAVTLEQSRKIIMEEQRRRRERKDIARENGLIMLLVSGIMVYAIEIVDGIIKASIWDMLFHSVPGYICLGVVIGIYLYVGYKLLLMEREE